MTEDSRKGKVVRRVIGGETEARVRYGFELDTFEGQVGTRPLKCGLEDPVADLVCDTHRDCTKKELPGKVLFCCQKPKKQSERKEKIESHLGLKKMSDERQNGIKNRVL